MKRLALFALVLCAWFHLAPAHAQFNGCSSFCGTSSSAIADAPGFNNAQGSGSASTLACTYTPVTSGTQNVAYTGATPSASGGVPAYTFSETGSLPTGLSINTSTGVISGTPSVNGSFPGIQVKVADTVPTTVNCGASFTLVIAPPSGIAVSSLCNDQTGSSTAVWAFSCAVGTVPASSTLVVSFGMQNPPQTVTSIIYDPSGANITLSQQIYSNSGGISSGIWSGVIPAGSGTKTVQITTANTMNALSVGLQIWLITGNISSTPVATSSAANSTTIAVVAGEVLLASVDNTSGNAWSFSGSTPVVPSSTSGSGNNMGGALWNPNITTTATYTVAATPSSWWVTAATFH